MTPVHIDLPPGGRLGGADGQRYEVRRKLGEGGMGAVYLVVDAVTESERALKVLHEGLFRDARALRDFAQESKVTGPFEGEARDFVVEVIDAGVCPKTGLPYLTMEFLKGEELGKRIERLGRIPPEEALTLVGQLAVVLDEAARHGVVHRDLKPENLFLTSVAGHPVLKVLDFGIAKVLRDGVPGQSRMIGTPVYMAPEQFEARPLSPRTDLWALGLIVFTALTGMTFWRNGDSAAKVIHEVLFGPRALATERAREGGVALPAGFDAWFARCTHNDPASRFERASDAAEALRAIEGWSAPTPRGPQDAAATAPEAPEAPEALGHAQTIDARNDRTVASLPTRIPTTHRPAPSARKMAAAGALALALVAPLVIWAAALTIAPKGGATATAPRGPTLAERVAASNPWRALRALPGLEMQAHEVTREEFSWSMGDASARVDPALPRADVEWQDASSFCAAAGGRLPTRAEWRGAFAGTEWEARVAFPHALHAAGGAQADKSPDGLDDMTGNLGEWVSDGAEGPLHAWMGAAYTDREPDLIRGRLQESTLSGAGPKVGFRCVRGR